MNFDAEAVQVVCKKLDSYLDAIDESEDYDFIGDLVNPNQTLMALMIARGYLRKQIEISSTTVPLLFTSEAILHPIFNSTSGDEDV